MLIWDSLEPCGESPVEGHTWVDPGSQGVDSGPHEVNSWDESVHSSTRKSAQCEEEHITSKHHHHHLVGEERVRRVRFNSRGFRVSNLQAMGRNKVRKDSCRTTRDSVY